MKLKLTIILLFPYLLIAQQKFSVIGTWKSCLTKEKSKLKDCSEDDFDDKNLIYTFQKNGTYTTNRTYKIDGKEYIRHGTWTYKRSFLTLTSINEKGGSNGTVKKKIKWVNEDIFYIKAPEGTHKSDPMYYMGYVRQ